MRRSGFLSGWSPFGEDFFPEVGEKMDLSPKVDVSRDDGHYMLTAEFPGMDKDEIHVDVKDGVLTLSGEKKREFEEEKEGYHYSERSYGSFSRSFCLPPEAQEEEIQAKLEKGVLTISIPVAEKHVKKIAIAES
ncbi:MAG: Hsp20/alpha crystallin family protein [Deltaproteobacteria bacterium]